MKHELPCAVVRDLLPNYLEGLTSPETNQAVEAHLAACPDCAACKEAMGAGSTPAAVSPEQKREVDYLKKVKQKSRRRVWLAVLCTVCLFVTGIALKLFVIGEPASREGMSWALQEDGNALNIRVYSTWSAVAYCRWTLENEDGIVHLRCSKVLPSPLYNSADYRERIPLEGVREVWLANQLLWQDDTVIFASTLEQLETATPYVGDAAALGNIVNHMNIRPLLGDFTHSLQTAQEPYRWTLDFSADSQGVFKKSQIDIDMPHYAAQMLALVENLGEVGWTWTDEDGVFHENFITLEQVNALLQEWTADYNAVNGTDWEPLPSVKDYTASPAAFQQLLKISAP